MKQRYFSIFFLCSLLAGKAFTQDNNNVNNIRENMAASSPYFSAYQDGSSGMVLIRWQLASEINTDHYVIERAEDTVHFAPLRELVARGGDGEGPAYTDEDNSATGKWNYYRLKIVSKDGNAFYSPAIAVDMTGKITASIKPTVLNMGSTLRLNSYYPQPLTVNFFDGSGKMMATYLVNGTSFDVNVSNWSKGLYIYRFSDPRHPLISAGKIMVL
jgi:hypothetical protein